MSKSTHWDPTEEEPPSKPISYVDAVIGHEIRNFRGDKVIKHTTPAGDISALSIEG